MMFLVSKFIKKEQKEFKMHLKTKYKTLKFGSLGEN